MSTSSASAQNPLLKLVLEMGPLVVFFLANTRPALFIPFVSGVMPASVIGTERAGIFAATAVFMLAVVIATSVSYWLTRKLPIMPVVSVVVVLVFGGLTLWLADETFIKLKPTIVNSLFGAVLLGGLAFGKSLLAVVLDSVMKLDAAGWRVLTFRWAMFFFVLAGLNEIVWRTQSTDFWVNFKVWGVMPLTMIFALSQTPLIMRHTVEETTEGAER